MLILASLSGIQDFLFDVREAGGGQARALRHRSFRIQLIAECVALRLLDVLRLPAERVVFAAAGKVCIDARGLPSDGVAAVRAAVADMERRLLHETHGRLRLAVALPEPSSDFAEQFERGSRDLALSKMRSHSTTAHANGGWRDDTLLVSAPWDADLEAERDAAVGRDLVRDRWLTIRRADGADDSGGLDTLGLRVRLGGDEPTRLDGLLSCSNLAEPERAPRGIDRRLFHPRRLARHVPRDERGNPISFAELAGQARGAPMLGVFKADADALGEALTATLRGSGGDALAAMRTFSRSLDRFFAEAIEAETAGPRSRWTSIYTVFSGGDDLLAVGPWDVMLDFAGHMRRLFDQRFGPGAAGRSAPVPLTISAGVAIIRHGYPIHLAATQADELLERAKGDAAPRARQPRDQCAALGGVWKWADHDAVIGSGRRLADWVDAGVLQRGWLHTLLQLSRLRRGEAGPEHAGVHPALATSRLAYHVARNWPQSRAGGPSAPGEARAWIDAILREFDRFDATPHVETVYLPAIVRYALLATRSGGSEDNA